MNGSNRLCGILLPLFSVRSAQDLGVGDFGSLPGFFTWLGAARQKLWMTLPLLPTAHNDPSPYSTASAFGLNPLFIDVRGLPVAVALSQAERATVQEARASATVRYDLVFPLKEALLERGYAAFLKQGTAAQRERFEVWARAQKSWLDDFALFTALSEENGFRAFWEWPAPLAMRQGAALNEARQRLAKKIGYQTWLQWVAEEQWQKVRDQARAAGVLICGDEPFIISQNSADAWVHPGLLRRDARLGVPPDDFAADGQDWGLPWFDFEAMAREDYSWLKARAQKAASYYDLRRVDHAIGYFRQWVRDEQTPRGRFVPSDEPSQRALGEKHFRLLSEGSRIVAEDLGVIPPFAREVLTELKLPGYEVMRWARRDGVYTHPHQYPAVSLVTTGTHDTETLKAWWENAQPWEREAVIRTFPEMAGQNPSSGFSLTLHDALLRSAMQASSELCVLPWQDVFSETSRVNLPGTVGPHNWVYRMRPQAEELLSGEETRLVAQWIAKLTQDGHRA
ncbi:MAG: 4-alpha-glucanotransferase [Myxococcaceae bacterium]|nr:4-alpha-glucanotransferase [Myxococcaceae bacterium]